MSDLRGEKVRLGCHGKEMEVCRQHTYPQIPVDFTPIVTSPGVSLSPDLTSSRAGSDSAIQSSCFGLVKTPIFGFDGVVIIVEDIVRRFRSLGEDAGLSLNCDTEYTAESLEKRIEMRM
jgi:hypothetical protein